MKNKTGFTLIELLVVISIISLLFSMVFVGLRTAREKGKVGSVVSNADALRKATELYCHDMGFYPPDLGRGWDPGFLKPLPWNPDTGATTIPSCDHCPTNWDQIVQERWDGPYLNLWPYFTPWKGKYDYNYWPTGATRYGCSIPSGIYIGIQRDYADENPISSTAEQIMIDRGIDFDGCLNGETQLVLVPL